MALLHQIGEQVEHLRLDLDERTAAPQFAAFKVERMIAERQRQRIPPRSARPGVSLTETQAHLKGK
jgi:hypothetical protein